MQVMSSIDDIKAKYEAIKHSMHERGRRLWAAAEAISIGWGGVKAVHEATGIAQSTICAGKRELEEGQPGPSARVRRSGAGRPPAVEAQPGLLDALKQLVEPATRGDPESTLRWSSISLRKLVAGLTERGFKVSPTTVGTLLKEQKYSLQANKKTHEGKQHPDRDGQHRYIAVRLAEQHGLGNPVISVDTKKKELVGNYKNAGRDWRPRGSPVEVNVHDFKGELGRASPYGIFDIFRNRGWVNVGMSADTAEFAVESIRRWWRDSGSQYYSNPTELLITADCGGSNGYRVRLWKVALQQLADELGFCITVCHLPPGTSKWNKIEHHLFAYIAQNWRGQPLVDYATIIKLISATTTTTGLKVTAALDENVYPKGRKVTPEEMADLRLDVHAFHPEWNYTIHPRPPAETDSRIDVSGTVE